MSEQNKGEMNALVQLAVQGTNEVVKYLNENPSVRQEFWEFYKQNKLLDKQLQYQEKVVSATLKREAQQYAFLRDVIGAIFQERSGALNAHYATLQKGLDTDDRDLMIESLRGIANIVTTSPLSFLDDFDEFSKALTTGNKDDIIELDF